MLRLACLLAGALLVQACDEPRTVVLKPSQQEAPAAMAPAPVPPVVAAAPEPAPVVAPAPVAAPSVPEPADGDGPALLAAKSLLMPVEGVKPRDLSDTYTQSRGGRVHEAIDIMAPHGTRVVAVEDGKVVKLFTSVPGGLTVYQFDPQGNLAYYYAHLDRYAEGLKEGMQLKRGDLVGYVGSTGNASPQAPHLHFAVFRLGPQRQWWKGEALNPYPALSR